MGHCDTPGVKILKDNFIHPGASPASSKPSPLSGTAPLEHVRIKPSSPLSPQAPMEHCDTIGCVKTQVFNMAN